MAKAHKHFWLGVALIGLLAACGGGGGGDRAVGVESGPPAAGAPVPPPDPVVPGPVGYADADEIFAFITNASLGDDGHAVVDFQVTDGNNTAIIDLTVDNIELTLVKLQASELGNNTGEWQSYINRVRDSSASESGAVLQATNEGDGEFSNFNNGFYRYVFSTDVNNLPAETLEQATIEGRDLSYEPNRTHRVGMQFSDGPNAANPTWDWIPASGATGGLFSMEIATTVNCNRCHDQLAFHRSNRIEVKFCVTCHNPGTSSSSGGYTVSFKSIIHRIHRGSNLPSVQEGADFGFAHVNFPQDIRNCQNCHMGSATSNDFYPDVTQTSQGDNWSEFPTRIACGSCHDNVNFDNHRGGQPDNSRCASCHSVGGRAGSIASSHALLVRDEGANYLAEVLSVTHSGPGEAPSVDIQVTNPNTGEAYDILNDPPFTNAGASLNVKLGWSTGDYENTGNGSEQSSMISQSALGTATVNGDGTFNVQFSATIPDGSEAPGVAASGSGVAVIDGHPNVVLEEDGEPESIFITDAHAFFSIDESDGSPRARRKIVDTQNCLVCHQNLVLHGGNRADNVESCVGCHNPRNSDRDVREIAANPPTDGKQQESIHFTRMVHGIHAAGYRENPLQIVGFRGFTTHVFDEDRVQFPGKLNNCITCHGDSGFELPLAASVRGTSIDTGDDREDPADDILISPTASACSSCHDSSVAAAHMEQNGGSFSTTQAALDGGEVIEQCELCHGPGRSVGVRAVHGL